MDPNTPAQGRVRTVDYPCTCGKLGCSKEEQTYEAESVGYVLLNVSRIEDRGDRVAVDARFHICCKDAPDALVLASVLVRYLADSGLLSPALESLAFHVSEPSYDDPSLN